MNSNSIFYSTKIKEEKKTTWVDLNPKVTSTNELYGVVLLATREWKDGLMEQEDATCQVFAKKSLSNDLWMIFGRKQ